MFYGQQDRPPEERLMSQESLEILDRQRAEKYARLAKQPELFAQLDRIEAMLKELLSR